MAIEIRLSTMLKEYVGGPYEIELDATTIREALAIIERNEPELYRSICDDAGNVRRHVHLFVNDDFVPANTSSGLNLILFAGDILSIWPAVSGG